MRISRVIRRARSAARKKGIPLDKLLPVAEGLVGVLLGLSVGWIAWAIVRGTLVNYRAETVLEISIDASKLPEDEQGAAASRRTEAATRVRDEILGAAFQEEWKEEALEKIGLGGTCRLDAVMHKDREGQETGDVVLTCSGRPSRAARLALLDARRRIAEREKPLTLKPLDLDKDMDEVRGRIARIERDKRSKEQEQERLKPSLEEDRRRRERDDNIRAARQRHGKAAGLLAVKAAREQEHKDEMKGLQGELDEKRRAFPGLKPLEEAEMARRLKEQQELKRLLTPEARADSTEQHPVRKRLREIQVELKISELPGKISREQAALRQIAKLRGDEAAARKALAALRGKYAEDEERDAARRKQRDAVRGDLTRIVKDLRRAEEDLAKLKSKPHLPVAVGADRALGGRAPAAGWIFYLLGVVGGVGLVVVVHRRVVPMLTLIEDEVTLADKLRVPVLGKVPRLAMLERR